ncbi:MAG: CHRD domain-containing protein [Solirubrobacteraceae bacterium]
MLTRGIAVPLLAAAIGIAACGSSSSPNSTGSGRSGTTTVAAKPIPDRTYSVGLRGSAEVPKGSPTGGGSATIILKGVKQQVCWTFRLSGLPKPTAAHIHFARAGAAGPILIPLGAPYAATGCVSMVPRPELALIEASPSRYYVNVHTASYPNGAVRGQL